MIRAILFLLIVVTIGTLGFARGPVSAQTCKSMDLVKNKGQDATPAITECLTKLGEANVLKLSPGTYRLLTPLTIDKAVTIETAAIFSGQNCSKVTGANCAVLAIGQMAPSSNPNIMPIEVTTKNVQLRSIAVVGGTKRDIGWQRHICLDQHARPLGGGIRVKADEFQMTNVLLKDFSCYTALEIVKGVKGAKIIGNVIGPNGNHMIRNMWSDGITIHDSELTMIKENTFKDNTDVQLILGGCKSCTVVNNIFIHSSYFNRSSFAEIMIHSWPDTSGDYTGSIISGNSINCGSHRSCGYGIMIGSEPWYPSRVFGGTVRRNRVTNALMAINIDKLTGPMNVGDNSVLESGGVASSDCGIKRWPAYNIAAASLEYIPIKPKNYFSVNTEKCLLNRTSQ